MFEANKWSMQSPPRESEIRRGVQHPTDLGHVQIEAETIQVLAYPDRHSSLMRPALTLSGFATMMFQLLSVESQVDLKRFLSILSDRILESRVEPGMPSLIAAPEGPDTLPLLSRNAASIISISRVASFRDSSG